MRSLLEDPWVAAQVDAAVAPYQKVWPPYAVEAFRQEVAATIAANSGLSVLVREANPNAVYSSGEVHSLGATPAASSAKVEAKVEAKAEPKTGTE